MCQVCQNRPNGYMEDNSPGEEVIGIMQGWWVVDGGIVHSTMHLFVWGNALALGLTLCPPSVRGVMLC